jgi:hypothetical protein
LVPAQYRHVAVAHVDIELTPDGLGRHFMGREVYRRTEFIVVRAGTGPAGTTETAIIRVTKASEEPLLSPVTSLEIVALPADCVWLNLPSVDTAIPSALARAAGQHAPGARCAVIEGLYHHVSFIVDPAPLRVRVTEVVPPWPPKLLDQAQRVLDTADDLPPIELVPDLVDLAELARPAAASRYLLPCRGSGFELDGAELEFLDQRPPRREWTLIGCARSRALHQWFYGDVPETVELCPRTRPVVSGQAVLAKCCLLEEHNELDGSTVTVPWGASLGLVKQALTTLISSSYPSWSPA